MMKTVAASFLCVAALSNFAQAWTLSNEPAPPPSPLEELKNNLYEYPQHNYYDYATTDDDYNLTNDSYPNYYEFPNGTVALESDNYDYHHNKTGTDEEYDEILDKAEAYDGEIDESIDSVKSNFTQGWIFPGKQSLPILPLEDLRKIPPEDRQYKYLDDPTTDDDSNLTIDSYPSNDEIANGTEALDSDNNDPHLDDSENSSVEKTGTDEEFDEILDKAEIYIGEIGESIDAIEAMIKSIKRAESNKQTIANVPDLFLDVGEQDKIDVEDMYDVATDFLEEILDKTEEMQSEIDEALEDLNTTTANLLPRNEILISLRSVQTALASQAKTLTAQFRKVDEMRGNQNQFEDEAATDEENFSFLDMVDEDNTNETDDGTDEFSLSNMGNEEDDDSTDNDDDDEEDESVFLLKLDGSESLLTDEKTKNNVLNEMLPVAESVNETFTTTVTAHAETKLSIVDGELTDTVGLVSNNEQVDLSENENSERTLNNDQQLRDITAILESNLAENQYIENEEMASTNLDSTRNLKLNLLQQQNMLPNSETNNTLITVADELELDIYNNNNDIPTPYPIYEDTTVSNDYNGYEFTTESFETNENMLTSASKVSEETTQQHEAYYYIDEMTTMSSVDQNSSSDNTIDWEHFSLEKFYAFLRDNNTLYPPNSDADENRNIDFMFPETQNENSFGDDENLKNDMKEDNDDFGIPLLKPKETEDSKIFSEFSLDMTDNFNSMNEHFPNDYGQETDDQSDNLLSDEDRGIENNEKSAQPSSTFDPYAFLNKDDVKLPDESIPKGWLTTDDDTDGFTEVHTNDIFPSNKPEEFESILGLNDLSEVENPGEENQVMQELIKKNAYDDITNEDEVWKKPILDQKQEIISNQIQSFRQDKEMLELINKQKIEDNKIAIDDDKLSQQSFLLWLIAGICLVSVGVLILFFSLFAAIKRRQKRKSRNCMHVPYTMMEDGHNEVFGKLSVSKSDDQKKVYNIQV